MKFHLALLAAAAFAACVTGGKKREPCQVQQFRNSSFAAQYLGFFIISGQDDCDLDNDTAYGGSDILVAGFHNLKDSWEECQESCQVGFAFFIFLFSNC